MPQAPKWAASSNVYRRRLQSVGSVGWVEARTRWVHSPVHLSFAYFHSNPRRTMKSSYPILRTLTVIVALCGMTAGNALADCPSPYRPSVESVDGVTRLNAYAEGTHCIIGPTPYCSNCVSGYQHTCDAYGRWKVNKAFPCAKSARERAAERQRAAEKERMGSEPHPRNSQKHQPNQQLCEILGTC